MNEKISQTVPLMRQAGIHNIEISSFHPYEQNLDVTNYTDTNILLHNFSPPDNTDMLLNLCSPSHSTDTIEFIKKRIQLTKRLGQNYYSFHAGYRVDNLKDIYTGKPLLTHRHAMDMFIFNLGEIIRYAEKEKIHIGVENHFCIKQNKDNLILYDIDDWVDLFNIIDSDYLHLHLDIGHLKVSAFEHGFNPEVFVKKLGRYILAVHLHDNTGMKIDCHTPFNKDLWFNKYLFNFLHNLEYIILETRSYGDLETITDMLNLVERWTV